jgi:hypothetical protein
MNVTIAERYKGEREARTHGQGARTKSGGAEDRYDPMRDSGYRLQHQFPRRALAVSHLCHVSQSQYLRSQ